MAKSLLLTRVEATDFGQRKVWNPSIYININYKISNIPKLRSKTKISPNKQLFPLFNHFEKSQNIYEFFSFTDLCPYDGELEIS